MSLSPEVRRARRREKRLAWFQELGEVERIHSEHRRRAAPSYSERQQRAAEENAELLARVHRELRSRTFRAWYEAITGERPERWLAEVIVDPIKFERRFRGVSQLDWTRERIEEIWAVVKNPEKTAAQALNSKSYSRRRLFRVRLATPPWANFDKMAAFYAERDRLTEETRVPHEVDHIIPIMNRKVCGLHCQFNLRVVTATVNRQKKNSFEPG